MNKKILQAIFVIIVLAFGIHYGVDAWQDSVTIYASSCETSSGEPLPKSVCRWIVNYRFEKGQDI